MAIGIATSLLIYMLLNTMSNDGGDGGYSEPSTGYGKRYGNYYRSQRLRNKVLTRENSNLTKFQTDDSCIKQNTIP